MLWAFNTRAVKTLLIMLITFKQTDTKQLSSEQSRNYVRTVIRLFVWVFWQQITLIIYWKVTRSKFSLDRKKIVM